MEGSSLSLAAKYFCLYFKTLASCLNMQALLLPRWKSMWVLTLSKSSIKLAFLLKRQITDVGIGKKMQLRSKKIGRENSRTQCFCTVCRWKDHKELILYLHHQNTYPPWANSQPPSPWNKDNVFIAVLPVLPTRPQQTLPKQRVSSPGWQSLPRCS